jgi:hypothetical protein
MDVFQIYKVGVLRLTCGTFSITYGSKHGHLVTHNKNAVAHDEDVPNCAGHQNGGGSMVDETQTLIRVSRHWAEKWKDAC